jgi:hypothetical protein
MIGRFADVRADGARAIVTRRDDAVGFAEGGPFVRRGVVKAWRVLDWNESPHSAEAAGHGTQPRSAR